MLFKYIFGIHYMDCLFCSLMWNNIHFKFNRICVWTQILVAVQILYYHIVLIIILFLVVIKMLVIYIIFYY